MSPADLRIVKGDGCDRDSTLCPGLEQLVVDAGATRHDLERIFYKLNTIERKVEDLAGNVGVLVENIQTLVEALKCRT